MTTKNRIILVLVVCVIALVGIIAQMTKPPVLEDKKQSDQAANVLPKNPLDARQIRHMHEVEKIDFGADATHDIGVWVEGDKIHVVISEKLLQQHGGAELLSKLSLPERDNLLTPPQFQRFLGRLHDALAEDEHDEHEHK